MKILKKFEQFVNEKNTHGLNVVRGKDEPESGAGFSKENSQEEFGINPLFGKNEPGKFKIEGENGFGHRFNNQVSDKIEKFDKGSKGFGKLPLRETETDNGTAKFAGQKGHGKPQRKQDEEDNAKFESEEDFGKHGGE